MPTKAGNFKQDLQMEFLRALHDEKTKTQGERATYISAKFAFITGLFGLGALNFGTLNFGWLLYFIPLVAIGYDLYVRAADLSIKKMGAFLRSHASPNVSDMEKEWESFAAQYRDKLAQLATTLFTTLIILAAAAYIFVQEPNSRSGRFLAFFFSWLFVSLVSNLALWRSHQNQIRRLDELIQKPSKSKAG